MRLLRVGPGETLTFTKDLKHSLPKYAILSHTWGDEDDEVSFQDIVENTGTNKPGYKKLVFCCKQAAIDKLDHFWVDTCCIDKTSSAELTESITSMFIWYQNAEVCYVYLTDVSKDDRDDCEISQATWLPAFRGSRWFSRGWTLQELLAPKSVCFFDGSGFPLGNKATLKSQIREIAGIEETALHATSLTKFKISDRYEWARKRETTREEDWAYCLQGVFGVFFSPLYGEGKRNAVRRLIKEVKDDALGIETQTFVIDAVGKKQILSPILLDIALLETFVRFDEARAQNERSTSNLDNHLARSTINNVLVSGTAATFFAFLRRLLLKLTIFQPAVLLALDKQLEENSAVLRGVIASSKKSVFDLQQEEEQGQTTLKLLENTQDFIYGQMEVSTQNSDNCFSIAEEREILKQYVCSTKLELKESKEIPEVELEDAMDADYSRLREQLPKLSQECQQLRHSLKSTLNQVVDLRKELEVQVNEREAEREEAERLIREREGQSVWQQIQGWINWLFGF